MHAGAGKEDCRGKCTPISYLELLGVRGAPNGHPLRCRAVLGLHVLVQAGVPGKLEVLRVVVGLVAWRRGTGQDKRSVRETMYVVTQDVSCGPGQEGRARMRSPTSTTSVLSKYKRFFCPAGGRYVVTNTHVTLRHTTGPRMPHQALVTKRNETKPNQIIPATTEWRTNVEMVRSGLAWSRARVPCVFSKEKRALERASDFLFTHLHTDERGSLHAADAAQKSRVARSAAFSVGESGLPAPLVLLHDRSIHHQRAKTKHKNRSAIVVPLYNSRRSIRVFTGKRQPSVLTSEPCPGQTAVPQHMYVLQLNSFARSPSKTPTPDALQPRTERRHRNVHRCRPRAGYVFIGAESANLTSKRLEEARRGSL